jgi:PPM family protein phosphatase
MYCARSVPSLALPRTWYDTDETSKWGTLQDRLLCYNHYNAILRIGTREHRTIVSHNPGQQHDPRDCPHCQQGFPASARFCPHCGASAGEPEPDNSSLPGGQKPHVLQDTLNLRELREAVETGLSWWEQQVQVAEGVAREQAHTAVQALNRALDSLSEHLEHGQESVKITSRLPPRRSYRVGCPVCGRGNRAGARFCQSCGSLLPDSPPGEGRVSRRLSMHIASQSDQGQVRQNNEDTCYTGTLRSASQDPAILLLVADGMGGARAGERASQMASETIQQELVQGLRTRQPATLEEWQDLLRTAATTANQHIYAQSRASADHRGMGTTLTVALIVGGRVHLAHVGDSRAYLLSPLNPQGVEDDHDYAPLVQLTTDHTLVARLVDIGHLTVEEARALPQRNMLYRALGTEPVVEIDTMSHPLHGGEVLLLCSDGLTTHVEDHELTDLIVQAPNPESVCAQMVALANRRGGKDNISIIVAKVEED